MTPTGAKKFLEEKETDELIFVPSLTQSPIPPLPTPLPSSGVVVYEHPLTVIVQLKQNIRAHLHSKLLERENAANEFPSKYQMSADAALSCGSFFAVVQSFFSRRLQCGSCTKA